MGSSKYRAEELPQEVTKILDAAMDAGATFIVAEAHGACRLFQDYLASKGYRGVVVGHARSIRYNTGGWRDHKYGDDLKERERNMIIDCDRAIVIWQDESGVIAENLEYLKKLGMPTFIYEYDSSEGSVRAGELDPRRIYRKYYPYWNSM
jgi:hypothetical protein